MTTTSLNTPAPADTVTETAPSPTLSKEFLMGDSTSKEALNSLLNTIKTVDQAKVRTYLKTAKAKLELNDYHGALEDGKKATTLDPKSGLAWLIMAIALEKLEQFTASVNHYLEALKDDSISNITALNLGRLATRLGQPEFAIQFYSYAIMRTQNCIEGINNLASAYRDLGRFDEAIDLIKTQLTIDPSSDALWNTLGSIVNKQGKSQDAITFYQEAIRLNPDNPQVWYNASDTLTRMGLFKEAIQGYEKALDLFTAQNSDELVLAKWGITNCRLSAGILEDTWHHFRIRLENNQENKATIPHPIKRFDIETSPQGKKLLVMGEQGLGDEILFGTILQDLIAEMGDEAILTLAVERRLVPLFARSFPRATVLNHISVQIDGKNYRTISDSAHFDKNDFYLHMGDICERYRWHLKDFTANGVFLTADQDRVAHWKQRLSELGSRPKVGILWKSAKMTADRVKYFASFDSWKHVLENKDVQFINLQYGNCQEELAKAKALGFDIWTPDGIDLMRDLDEVTALCTALDLIIGPANTTTNLAAAAGTKVWNIMDPYPWTMLGTDHLPWYQQVKCYMAKDYFSWHGIMKTVAEDLTRHFATK